MPERNLSSNDNVIRVNVAPDQPVIFEFAASEAFFGREGNNLNITLESGEQIITEDYFIADAAGHLPPLQFADIPAVAGELFLTEASPELDIAPASGEIRSGGINNYADGAGDLVAGLDGSGSLDGLGVWSDTTQRVEIQSQGVVADAPQAAQPVAPPPVTPSVTPPVTPPVQPPVTPNTSTPISYDARAVVYDLSGQGQGAVIRFAVPNGVSVNFDASENGFVNSFATTVINGVTYYEMQISADGEAAAQQAAGSNPPANVYDYITLTVDGSSKVVQVIINQSGIYSSQDEDAANEPGNGGVPVPEWHMELGAVQGAERILGAAADEMWLNGNMYADSQAASNKVDLGGGDDALTVGGSVWAQGGGENVITGGQGNNVIVINGWVYARDGGTNVIDAGDGDITVNGPVYVYEEDNTATASSNTLAGGNITVQQNIGSGTAQGVVAFRHDAENTLEAQGNINIDLASASGGSLGVYAEGTSSVDILKAGGDIDISVVSHHDTVAYEALGIEANQGSTVTLDAGGDISITAQGTGQSNATAFMGNSNSSLNARGDVNFNIDGDRGASGIFRGGDLTAGGSVNIDVNSANGAAVGLDVFGTGSSNVTAGDSVNINVHSGAGAATGIEVYDKSQVRVQADNINVDVASDTGTALGLNAVYASSGKANSITLEGENVTVSAAGQTGRAMSAERGNSNAGQVSANIVAKGSGVDSAGNATFGDTALNVELNATSYTMYADGMSPDGRGGAQAGVSNNIVGSGAGDIVSAQGAVRAANLGVNRIMTGDGDDSINVAGYAQAVTSGRNIIDAGDGDNTVSAQYLVAGGSATDKGSAANIVQSGSGDDAITLSSNASYAMYAWGEGNRNVINAGDGDNTVTVNKWANAIDGAANIIETGSGDDTITFGGTVTSQTGSSGLGGATLVDAGDGDNSINFNNAVSAAGAIVQGAGQPVLGEGGSMSVSAGSGDDRISFAGQVTARVGSSIDVNAGDGDNEVTFSGPLHTHINSTVNITAGSGDDTVNTSHIQTGGDSHVVINTGTGQDTVNINATGNASNTSGLTAYVGGTNTVISDTVNVQGGDRGLYVDGRMEYSSIQSGFTGSGEAANIITANTVNISADNTSLNTGNTAYGLYATGNAGSRADNVIQAQGSQVNLADGSITFGHTHAITVVISAESGSADKAVAMLAKGTAVNYIVGSDLGDSITIQGHVQVSNNKPHGTAEVGENTIATGAGDDTVSIQGHVQVGALNIYAGEGNDMLVLVADSLEQFNQYYRDWLTEMDGTDWTGMSIENVQIQVSDPTINLADVAWLTNPDGVFASSGIEVNVIVNGDYTLNIDGYADAGSASLGELVGIVDGFDSLDMSGGKSDILNIDGLLDGLGNLDPLDEFDMAVADGSSVSAIDLAGGLVLRITGDDGEDKVMLGGNWSQNAAGSVEYGSVTYDIYTNSDAENQYVLVQQNLLMG